MPIQSYRFLKQGVYTFEIEQAMRYGDSAKIEQLPGIMEVGLRIENKTINDKNITKAKSIFLWLFVLSPIIILLLTLYLTSVGLFGDLPSFEQLENPKSNLATEIISSDGVVLGKYFLKIEAT